MELKKLETYEEASQNSTWHEDEIEDLKLISCKWVYKIKHSQAKSIGKYKGRLVAGRFSQHYRLDYDEMFNLVAKITTVRVLLALEASKNWKLWQMDVKNDFLYREFDREIYMNQPRRFDNKAQRILRYIKGTTEYNFLYKRSVQVSWML